LVESRTTVIIPLDDRIFFVSSLNRADFSSRLSEVSQTLDPISGFQFLVGGTGFAERRLLARSESGIAPGCDRGACRIKLFRAISLSGI
jgi:hypothetical protein